MSGAFQDLRYCLRSLRGSPAFTLIVVLNLGLGIGANSAIFSFVNGVLARPLPYVEPERLILVCETHPERNVEWCGASPANLADWARQSKTLGSLALARDWPFGITLQGKSIGVSGGIATAALFDAFKVQPERGRLFQPGDMDAGREFVAVVSHRFWQSRLGAKESVIGQPLLLDGQGYELIGVLPRDFEVLQLDRVDVWIPLWPERQHRRDWRGFIAFGRLAQGTSLETARSELATIRAQLAQQYPDTNAAWGLVVDSLHERTVRSVKPALLAFQFAVALVLLIACANVANLMMARASTRERELGVRLALGASRGRLLRQFLIESLVLALAGATLGLLVATWATDLFVGLAPSWLPRLKEVRLDVNVVAFMLALAVLTSILFGLGPALHSSRANLSEALRDGRGGTGTRGGLRARRVLVVCEIMLAFPLLAGAGLLLRSFANLLDWKPGFDRENLVLVPVFSSPGDYPKVEQVVQLFDRAGDELRTLPSVTSVGAGSAGPLFGGDGEQEFQVVGRPEGPAGEKPMAAWFDVDPNYFQTLRVPLVRGRYFTALDRAGTSPVAIINETFARRFWPGGNPLGQRVRLAAHQMTVEIVGIVADLRPFRPETPVKPEIYWPFAQAPRWAIVFWIRTATAPDAAVNIIRARLEQAAPSLQIGRVRTMDELVTRELVNPRFHMTLAALFAVVACAIAVAGIYGIISFSVAQQTREIGIRLALGAQPARILASLLANGLTLAAIGLCGGILGAVAVGHLIRSLLVGTSPYDLVTLAAASALLLAAAALASYIPARRALTVDPASVLRAE